MGNPDAVTFWLSNRQVNGVAVAVNGAEKLVKYSGKFYVVSGKTPGRRLTQSTIPARWKKILAGETPSSPPLVKPSPSLIDDVKVARGKRKFRREEVRQELGGNAGAEPVPPLIGKLPLSQRDSQQG